MLHLALVALLAAGSLTVANDGDKDKDAPRSHAQVGIVSESAEALPPVNDTYAYGRVEDTFLKVWAGYGWGQVDGYYNAAGDEVGIQGGAVEEITVQRAFVGAQVNFINLTNFTFGVGGQFSMFSREGTGTISGNTGFSPQQVKLYGEARGRVLGIHGGYIFDLGEEGSEIPNTGGMRNPLEEVSGLRDAIFFGGSFDYPSRNFRLFGGVDYFLIQENSDITPNRPSEDLIAFNFGGGVRISWVELGAAAIIHAQANRPAAGHQGSIAPYLRLSPPQLPVALSVRGAFMEEYADYGYSIGGANKPVTQMGFTAALTYGF